MSNQLLERHASGLHVEMFWIGGELVLTVGVNGEAASAIVPADKVFEAFEHPMLYLNDAQIARLFPRPTGE